MEDSNDNLSFVTPDQSDEAIEFHDILNMFRDASIWFQGNRKVISDIAFGIYSLTTGFLSLLSDVSYYAEKINNVFESAGPYMQELYYLGVASQKLGEHQYILWEYLSEEELRIICDGCEIDKYIESHLSSNNYKLFEKMGEAFKNELILVPAIPLYEQSMQAYDNEHYSLAAVGLTSIIDGLLSKVSNSSGIKIMARCESILKKMDYSATFDHDDYVVVTLIYTFWLTMKSFSDSFDFNGPEPLELNRHWIMHGRSTRKFSKLDCIKLTNIIYSLVLINGSIQIA